MCGGPSDSAMNGLDDSSSSSSKKPKQDSLLLELAAADDVAGFKRAVEDDGQAVDQPLPWYGRWTGLLFQKKMGFELRTPLMIAAMYGGTAVLEYILSTGAADVNRACGSDGVTALHCAASGGSALSVEAVKMLIEASADVGSVDAGGNRPGDLIPRQFSGSSKTKSLEALLLLGGAAAVTSSPSREEGSTKQGEKKEYPPDLTLPDIKNGVYSTDEFRMYTFKVKPCSRAYSHDWTECPFVHPGENARRRDPRKYHYSCVPCPEFRKGTCRNGDACEYAHGVFECWLHPAQYRTRLCKDETGCSRRVCFFAHKPEELRPLQPSLSSGMGISSSPRSSPGLPPLDMAAASAILMNQPLSPATSSALAAAVWMNSHGGGSMTPPLQLPSSRLKSALNARDVELELELLGLEGYQQQLIDEIANLSPRVSWGNSMASAASPARTADYGDMFASAAAGAQFQSQSGLHMQQNMNQKLLSSYSNNMPSSQAVRSSSSFGVDHSLAAAAIINSRASAFTKRSVSFGDRGALNRLPAAAAGQPSHFSNWGSPDGKLDWGIHGEELSKLRKSASFGYRSNTDAMGMEPAAEEPDLSWVQSLVKDGPAPASSGRNPLNSRGGGGGDFHGNDLFSPWADQLYMEQEQLVA